MSFSSGPTGAQNETQADPSEVLPRADEKKPDGDDVQEHISSFEAGADDSQAEASSVSDPMTSTATCDVTVGVSAGDIAKSSEIRDVRVILEDICKSADVRPVQTVLPVVPPLPPSDEPNPVLPPLPPTAMDEGSDEERGRERDTQRDVSPPPVRPKRSDYPGSCGTPYYAALSRYFTQKQEYDVRHGISLSPTGRNSSGGHHRNRSPLPRRSNTRASHRPPPPKRPRRCDYPGSCGTPYFDALYRYWAEKVDYERRHGIRVPSSSRSSSGERCRSRSPLHNRSRDRNTRQRSHKPDRNIHPIHNHSSGNTCVRRTTSGVRGLLDLNLAGCCFFGPPPETQVSSRARMGALRDLRETVLDQETLRVRELTYLLQNMPNATPDRNRLIELELQRLAELKRLLGTSSNGAARFTREPDDDLIKDLTRVFGSPSRGASGTPRQRHDVIELSDSDIGTSDDDDVTSLDSSVINSHIDLKWNGTDPGNCTQALIMMTSSNGNIFRVAGHLCGKFTGHWWIPHTKASDAELCCFLWSASE